MGALDASESSSPPNLCINPSPRPCGTTQQRLNDLDLVVLTYYLNDFGANVNEFKQLSLKLSKYHQQC